MLLPSHAGAPVWTCSFSFTSSLLDIVLTIFLLFPLYDDNTYNDTAPSLPLGLLENTHISSCLLGRQSHYPAPTWLSPLAHPCFPTHACPPAPPACPRLPTEGMPQIHARILITTLTSCSPPLLASRPPPLLASHPPPRSPPTSPSTTSTTSFLAPSLSCPCSHNSLWYVLRPASPHSPSLGFPYLTPLSSRRRSHLCSHHVSHTACTRPPPSAPAYACLPACARLSTLAGPSLPTCTCPPAHAPSPACAHPPAPAPACACPRAPAYLHPQGYLRDNSYPYLHDKPTLAATTLARI